MPRVCPGMKFNRLEVIQRVPGMYRPHYVCRCECGTRTTVRGDSLVSGSIKSCGCLHHETMRRLKTRHGDTNTRFHAIFLGMHSRCYTPSSTGYDLYGGRGIRVCDRWHTYENFKSDMHDSYREHFSLYSLDTQLDRIDNDGDYSPDNCRWATQVEQRNNNSRTRTFKATSPWGETFISKNLDRFAAIHGLNPSGVSHVINGVQTHHKGWIFEPLDR